MANGTAENARNSVTNFAVMLKLRGMVYSLHEVPSFALVVEASCYEKHPDIWRRTTSAVYYGAPCQLLQGTVGEGKRWFQVKCSDRMVSEGHWATGHRAKKFISSRERTNAT